MGFDYGTYTGQVDKLSALIAELKVIDDQLQAIRDFKNSQDDGNAGPGTTTTNAGTGGGVAHVHLGTTHPFTVDVPTASATVTVPGVNYPVGQSTETILRNMLNAVGDAGDWVTQEMIGFNVRTGTIIYPDSAKFESVATSCFNEIYSPVQVLTDDDFGGLDQTLGEWRGEAADEFAKTIYNKLGKMMQNQAFVAHAMHTILGASKAIIDEGQTSLQNLVTGLVKVVDEQLQQRHDSHQETGPSLAEVLTIASSVTAIIGAFTLPVPGAGEVLGVASTGLGYAAGKVDADKEKETVKAESAAQVLEELDRVSLVIAKNVERHWEALEHDQVRTLTNTINQAISERLFEPPSDALIEHPVSHRDFHPSDT